VTTTDTWFAYASPASSLVRADLLRGHLDGLLLAVLADAPGQGYELSQRLTERGGGVFGVNEGSLYPALHGLERGGLVKSAWSTGEGRRRRIYRLTSSGRRAVKDTRREWRAFSPRSTRCWDERARPLHDRQGRPG
jgi:DNA-binding PadR family transcriptional regulator